LIASLETKGDLLPNGLGRRNPNVLSCVALEHNLCYKNSSGRKFATLPESLDDQGSSGQFDATVAKSRLSNGVKPRLGDVAPTFLLPDGGGGLNVSITIAEGCGFGTQGYVGAEG
jgi:hypothetical protein